MDEEIKKAYHSWAEKGSCRINTIDVFPTFYEVDQALLECERQLNEVGLGTGYTSIVTRLDKLVEDRGTLYQYIWSLLYYVESKIDKPLNENFRLNATERISRIRLEDFEVDNTLGLTEAVYPFGSTTPITQEKVKLSFSDFTGTMAGELKLDGFSYSRTNGCIEEFSEIFVGQYETLRMAGLLEEEITWEEYEEQFLEQGTFYHDGSTGFENFVSSVLDITIVKPIIEAYIGEDLITGEDLSEMERGLKVVFAAIDLITLGGAMAATELGEVGLKEGLKWMGKTATIEFASNAVACGVGTLGEELGWPMAVTMLFSFAAGLTVSVKGTDVIFKGADGSIIRQLELKDVTANGKAYTPEELGDILKKQGIAVEVDAAGNTIKNTPEVVEDILEEVPEVVIEGGLEPGTLSNVDARKWYLEQEAKIPDLIDDSLPLEQQARQAFDLRNQYRTQARELMSDRQLAESLYATDPNLTWEQIIQKQIDKGLSGDDIYKAIIESSQRSRTSVNQSLGLE